MGRRLREDRKERGEEPMTPNMTDMANLTESYYNVLKRTKELSDRVHDLEYKVRTMGGDSRQLELKFGD
tara:strand:+ start:527 stop:733 length:207 start_codon:yes stop_codon:yes gene_type:complete